jgi:hypothetical protein
LRDETAALVFLVVPVILLPILWLSWLLVIVSLAGSGSERITLVVAVVIVGCGMGRRALAYRCQNRRHFVDWTHGD